jgi:hypothetical protein
MKAVKTLTAAALFILFCSIPCLAKDPVYASGQPVEGIVKQVSMPLEDNHKYGDNFQTCNQSFPKNYKPVVGDTVTVEFEGTSDIDMSLLGFLIVDSTPAVKYWKPLCAKVEYKDVKAGTPFSYVLKFVIEQNATATCSNRGADFVVYTGKDQKKEPTLKLTKFTYSITRK